MGDLLENIKRELGADELIAQRDWEIEDLEKEIRSLKKKLKRRDNKIIELEKKIKHYEKLLYKFGLRPLTIELRPDVEKE